MRWRADFDLDGLTYYYRGLDGNSNEQIGAGLIVGNSLLTARGIPAAGEGDLKTCLAMLIMDRLGAGGSYTEFYAMDFAEDFVLMGHDGPGHVAITIASGAARARTLPRQARLRYLGRVRRRPGPVTIYAAPKRLTGSSKSSRPKAVIPGPRLQIGNTNSRIRFGLDPAEFMERWCAEGPTHHVALGVGHFSAARSVKLARLLDLEEALVV